MRSINCAQFSMRRRSESLISRIHLVERPLQRGEQVFDRLLKSVDVGGASASRFAQPRLG